MIAIYESESWGFTLLEVMVVFGLLGLVISLLIPLVAAGNRLWDRVKEDYHQSYNGLRGMEVLVRAVDQSPCLLEISSFSLELITGKGKKVRYELDEKGRLLRITGERRLNVMARNLRRDQEYPLFHEKGNLLEIRVQAGTDSELFVLRTAVCREGK